MSSIGVYMNTDKCDERREGDFYPTPPEATRALAIVEPFPNEIWEPACGEGAISEVLKSYGFHVISTDIERRGYGGQLDFLAADIAPCKAIVTNPPFSLAEPFIRKAHALGIEYMALLLKSNYFHAGKRRQLFIDYRPSIIYPLSWRVDFTGGGANHFDCMWVVWRDLQSENRSTAYSIPLERPT